MCDKKIYAVYDYQPYTGPLPTQSWITIPVDGQDNPYYGIRYLDTYMSSMRTNADGSYTGHTSKFIYLTEVPPEGVPFREAAGASTIITYRINVTEAGRVPGDYEIPKEYRQPEAGNGEPVGNSNLPCLSNDAANFLNNTLAGATTAAKSSDQALAEIAKVKTGLAELRQLVENKDAEVSDKAFELVVNGSLTVIGTVATVAAAKGALAIAVPTAIVAIVGNSVWGAYALGEAYKNGDTEFRTLVDGVSGGIARWDEIIGLVEGAADEAGKSFARLAKVATAISLGSLGYDVVDLLHVRKEAGEALEKLNELEAALIELKKVSSDVEKGATDIRDAINCDKPLILGDLKPVELPGLTTLQEASETLSSIPLLGRIEDGGLVLASLSTKLGKGEKNLTLVGAEDLDGTGNKLDNILSGNTGANILHAKGGNDKVYGMGGDDTLVAGSGRGSDLYDGGDGIDTITFASVKTALYVSLRKEAAESSESGNDTIVNVENVVGGSGDDRIYGDGSHNKLSGGAGRDLLRGGGGNDRHLGGSGRDRLYSNNGNDALFGGPGGDRLYGGGGNDRLYGGKGNDTLSGGARNDRLYGGSGNDGLNGGRGNDMLDGGAGNDRLKGGAGADIFVFTAGRDVVKDFTVGEDVLDLSGLERIKTLDDVWDAARERGDDLVLNLDEGRLILRGVKLADLGVDDFLL